MTPLPDNGTFWNDQSDFIDEEVNNSSPKPLDVPPIFPPPVPPLWTPQDLDSNGKIPVGSRILKKHYKVTRPIRWEDPVPLYETADGCTTWGVFYCMYERIDTYWLLGNTQVLVSEEERPGHCYWRGVTVCPNGVPVIHAWGWGLEIGDPEIDSVAEIAEAQDFFDTWDTPPPPPPWTPHEILLWQQGESETIVGDYIVHRKRFLQQLSHAYIDGCIASIKYQLMETTWKWKRVANIRGELVEDYPDTKPVPNQDSVTRVFHIPNCEIEFKPAGH